MEHKREAATVWLRGYLTDEPIDSRLVKQAGIQAGFSERTLKRVAAAMGVVMKRSQQGTTTWHINREPSTQVLKAAKVLVYDIETFPARVEEYMYDLKRYNKFVNHRNVVEPGGLLAWAAHWLHEPHRVHYADIHDPHMLDRLWELQDEAEFQVTYNGIKFDNNKMRGYYSRVHMVPPSDSKQIDLIRTVRTLGLESNSLEYVCRVLDTPHKKLADETGGASNWRGVLEGDPIARKMMRRYNVGDVRATADVYLRLLPFIKNHPPVGMSADKDGIRCPRCGWASYEMAGSQQAIVLRRNRYRCDNCHGLFLTGWHSRVGVTRSA